MLYQVDTGAGLIGVKYINADSEDEAIEAAENEYQCDETRAEYNETLDSSFDDNATEVVL